MDNEMLCYVCVGGQMVKDANKLIENKGGRIITLLVNVHMPLDESCWFFQKGKVCIMPLIYNYL